MNILIKARVMGRVGVRAVGLGTRDVWSFR